MKTGILGSSGCQVSTVGLVSVPDMTLGINERLLVVKKELMP